MIIDRPAMQRIVDTLCPKEFVAQILICDWDAWELIVSDYHRQPTLHYRTYLAGHAVHASTPRELYNRLKEKIQDSIENINLVGLKKATMPLKKSSSKKARDKNIKEEMKTKPRKQAIAIGYAVQRKAKGKKR